MPKLGKLEPVYDKRTLLFESYVTPALPKPPTHDTDNLHRAGDWGVLGNDRVGDCVFAGADHETMNWLNIAGASGTFTDQTALSDYSAVTGYNPSDPNTDQGTVVLDALKYRRTTGVVDTQGQRHKIAAFVALEPGNHRHVREAIWLLDAVGVGFQFPGSAMDQFNRGRPWTVVAGAKIEGGHYVSAIGYDPRYLYVVTWGRIQKMSWGFFQRYCDEGFAILSEEYLKRGESPEGFSLDALRADLQNLGK